MSRPTSYFDREKKLHTPEAMFQLLEKRIGKPINGGGSSAPTGDASASGRVGDGPINTGSTPAPCLPLTWYAPVTTDDGGYIRSTCGLYTVTKSRSMGKWVYTASHKRTCLQGAHASAQEAKQAAQEHYRSIT